MAVIACASFWMAPADAQMSTLPERTDVGGARAQPEYTPVDLQLGAWSAAPELGINQGYDSNLFGLSDDVVGDGYLVVSPALRLSSDWGRHGLTLSARSALTRYYRHPLQDSNEYDLGAKGRLDLPQATVTLSSFWNQATERRGTNGIPLTRGNPSQVDSSGQSINLKRDTGVLALGLSLNRQSQSFSDIVRLDGSVASQRFRDSRSWAVEAGVGLVPRPDAAFGLAVRYAHNEAPFDPNRDSKALTIGGTGAVDLGLFRAELALGYLDHQFTNPVFKDYHGFTFRQTTYWYPTTLITVSLKAARALEGSGDPAAGAVIATSINGNVDFELLRNLVLRADIGRRTQRYRETARRLVSRDFGINGEYSFNRSVAFGAYARRECRDSSDATSERQYCASLIGVTLKLRR